MLHPEFGKPGSLTTHILVGTSVDAIIDEQLNEFSNLTGQRAHRLITHVGPALGEYTPRTQNLDYIAPMRKMKKMEREFPYEQKLSSPTSKSIQ